MLRRSGHSYIFVDDSLSWIESQLVCQSHGGYLIELHTEVELDWLQSTTAFVLGGGRGECAIMIIGYQSYDHIYMVIW